MPPRLPSTPCGTFLTSPITTSQAIINIGLKEAGLPPIEPNNNIEIECFLDLICPFSAKMYRTLYDDVVPGINISNNNCKDNNSRTNITIKIHHVIQPWHPQSTMVHEAALAVKRVLPGLYLGFIRNVYKKFVSHKNKFSDDDTWNKTRLEIYDELVDCLPTWMDDEDKIQEVKELLYPLPVSLVVVSSDSSSPSNGGGIGNGGNEMTQDIKWACKFHRTRGVHVTPTVFANGIEATQVSSGWKADDWNDFFQNGFE